VVHERVDRVQPLLCLGRICVRRLRARLGEVFQLSLDLHAHGVLIL
jgi:hypothetical protein